MTSLPLTKSNLKKFMNAYSKKMEGKHQSAPSEVSFASTRSKASRGSRGGKRPRGFGNKRMRNVHRKMLGLVQSIKPTVLRRSVLRNKLKMIKEGYFADVKDSKEDPKIIQNELDMLEKEIAFVKAALTEAYKGKAMPVMLWYSGSAASSANTALNTVVALDPNSSLEMASLNALFDLCICGGVEIHETVYSTAGTVAATATWGAAYDPLSSGAYNSVAAILPAAYHIGPIRISAIGYNNTGGVMNLGDTMTTRTGFHIWKVHIPEEPEMNIQSASSGTGICTGMWTDTTIGTQINGYIKPFLPAGGTAVVLQHEYYIGLKMRFKMRS